MDGASFSFSRLLTAPQAPGSIARSLAAFPAANHSCLVFGPAGSGLASLACAFAAHQAAGSTCGAGPTGQQGRDVVFLCIQPSMGAQPPVLPSGMDHNEPLLQRIKIRYLKDLVELRQYASCLHLLPHAPAAVVVHGLSFFFRPDMDKKAKERELSKTLALLLDATEAARAVSGVVCPLLVTDEGGPVEGEPTSKPFMYIIQRWLPLVLEVKGNASAGFSISCPPTCPAYGALQPQLQAAVVHYTLTNSLVVDHVEYTGG